MYSVFDTFSQVQKNEDVHPRSLDDINLFCKKLDFDFSKLFTSLASISNLDPIIFFIFTNLNSYFGNLKINS